MRIIVFILFISISTVFANNINSQEAKVSIHVEDTQTKDVISQIEKQTDYLFVYNYDNVDMNAKISLNVSNVSVSKVLTEIFKGTNISFQLEGTNILLFKRKGIDKVNQTPRKITGTVVDENNEAIIGATVSIKGTTSGTLSNIDGSFELTIANDIPDNAELVVSYIGYKSKTMSVKGQTNIQIVLDTDTSILNDVVVVGYGTTLRKNLTTSISSVKTEKISKSAVSNVTQMLMGRAAGLNATISSSQPGGNINLSIRGGGTPIFVVDGVMMPGSSLETGAGRTELPSSIDRAGLAGINPADIESIEILKDAAAAIYGVAAANGVVLITTKKGATGAPKVVYDSNISIVENQSYLKMLNAQDYMNISNVFNKENYLYNNKQYPYGDTPYDGGWTPLFSGIDIDRAQTTDWLDYVLKTGYINNQNISITGGTDKMTYYLGGNYYNYEGSVANAGMERFTLKSNISAQLLPFLNLTSTLNINKNIYNNSSVGGMQGDHGAGALQSAMTYPPYLSPRDEDGNYSLFQNFPNPESMMNINDKTKTTGYYANISAKIDIVKDMLSANLLYGINSENGERAIYIPSDIYFYQMYKSRGNLGRNSRSNQTLEATLSFQKQFGQLFRVDAVVGIGKYINKSNSLGVYYENVNDIINNDNIAAANGPFYPSSSRGSDEKRSQFARASVDFLDKYILSGTLRRDGTDKFFPDSKYAYFPSVSAAWKVSNEKFMRDLSFINLLKVRASYGQTGNDNLSSYLYGTFGTAQNYIKFEGNTVTYIPYLMIGADYPDVSWAKTTMKNMGVDFSILNDRISGSIDIFRNDVTRLLGEIPTSPLNMLGTRPVNGGHYKRVGWDANINTENIYTPDFKWNSIITLSRYNSIWIDHMPNTDFTVYQMRKGEPVGCRYFYKTDGVINIDRSNMPESQKSLPAENQLPGSTIIKDRDGDGIITTDDIYSKNIEPDIYIGFGNTFVYKDFDLDIFMYGQFGVEKYNYSYAWAQPGIMSMLHPHNSSEYAFTVWNSQTNPEGTRPGISKSGALPGNAGTNLDWQDASFVRVRNITLGYNLAGKRLGSLNKYINNIRFTADIQNPLIFTNFDGFDPEIRINGGEKGKAEYPQTRTYSFGIKVTF